jgi:hypothetical protein
MPSMLPRFPAAPLSTWRRPPTTLPNWTSGARRARQPWPRVRAPVPGLPCSLPGAAAWGQRCWLACGSRRRAQRQWQKGGRRSGAGRRGGKRSGGGRVGAAAAAAAPLHRQTPPVQVRKPCVGLLPSPARSLLFEARGRQAGSPACACCVLVCNGLNAIAEFQP